MNVEEIIFYNNDVVRKLPPHLLAIVQQWKLSKQIPGLRFLGKNASIDFINSLTDDDITLLEGLLKNKLRVEKFDADIVKHIKVPLSEQYICSELCNIYDNYHICLFRDDKFVYITFWR